MLQTMFTTEVVSSRSGWLAFVGSIDRFEVVSLFFPTNESRVRAPHTLLETCVAEVRPQKSGLYALEGRDACVAGETRTTFLDVSA